ncbi:MAG: BMP family protein [Firmicutes bacterium]|nr:BMP family protein [Bacillota bacterium]
MMKKLLVLVLALFMAIALLGCNTAKNEEITLKVGMAIPGAKTDGGWSQVAYTGLVMIQDELGAKISINENTTPADYERILRDYAKDGNDVVIGHGFEFSDAALAVGAEYPDTIFIVTSSDVTNNKNVGSISNFYEQAGFLKGAFAALMTKSNIVGGVGGLNIPPIANDIKGFEAGAKYINPNVKVLTAILGSDDVNKAKEQSLTFISQGADILMGNANAASQGVYLGAEEKGLYSIASIFAEYDKFDKTLISCAPADMSKAIFQTVENIQKGSYTAGFELMGVKQEIIDFTYSPVIGDKVPDEIKDKMAEIKDKMASGELDVLNYVK